MAEEHVEGPVFLAPRLYYRGMRTLIMLAILFSASSVRAADGLVDIPPGEDNIVVLEQGAKAPFTGQLYDNSTAFRWSGWLLQYKHKLSADRELQTKLCDADLKLSATTLELEKRKGAELTEDYSLALDASDRRIERLEHPPFFRTAWFGFTMGVVVTSIAVTSGALFLASH